MAKRQWAAKVILLAPGIFPKLQVGESSENPALAFKGAPLITLPTLTRNTFPDSKDPHVDAVKPDSPTKVPLFGANLIKSAALSHLWTIPSSVEGLVFLSGPEDTYVDSKKTIDHLKKKAPHFKVLPPFPGALHELDNELPEVSSKIYEEILKFLK